MPRAEYVQRLRQIQDDLLDIGSMVEKAIAGSLDALKSRDLEASRQIVAGDDAIDNAQAALEELCVDVMATQQPMAGDLRHIVTVVAVVSELERMGDYAEGIGKISLLMGDEPPLKPLIDIPRMGALGIGMLRQSLDALVNRNVGLAEQVRRADDEVDILYEQIYRELISFMLEDQRKITRATYLIWVAHNLERIADRATNIAERVIFVATGKRPAPIGWFDRQIGGIGDGASRSDVIG
ncbi:MAG: phosphate signaling complex protein PhoU [Actinobacteria bacterium]|nr:phosphate signaling complex protein PhoU [Actinomycetota bacterium]